PTSAGDPPKVVVPRTEKSVNATASLPLDISGNLGLAIHAAKSAEDASELAVQSAKNDLRRDVRKAFYRVLQSKELLDVAIASKTGADLRLANTKAQFEAGSLAKVDVLRADVQATQAESDRLAAANALDISKKSFNNQLALPVETPVDLAPVADRSSLAPTDDARLFEAAQRLRPDLDALRATAVALHAVTRAEERGLQPSLNLSSVVSRQIDPLSGTRPSLTTTALTLTWPIFDSGVTRARVKQDRQDEEALRIQTEQLALGISLEVRQATTNLANAAARLETAKRQVELAEEAFRLAGVRRDAGEGILLEVLDAQTDLTRARTQFVTTRYDYLAAYADLQRAIGVDDVGAALKAVAGVTR
ncbi:MAG: TolC family protein, partial [Fimbriimonas ginsengisoli]|nr:TolC family protein [Fimbriimonas ginsengisoli]